MNSQDSPTLLQLYGVSYYQEKREEKPEKSTNRIIVRLSTAELGSSILYQQEKDSTTLIRGLVIACRKAKDYSPSWTLDLTLDSLENHSLNRPGLENSVFPLEEYASMWMEIMESNGYPKYEPISHPWSVTVGVKKGVVPPGEDLLTHLEEGLAFLKIANENLHSLYDPEKVGIIHLLHRDSLTEAMLERRLGFFNLEVKEVL